MRFAVLALFLLSVVVTAYAEDDLEYYFKQRLEAGAQLIELGESFLEAGSLVVTLDGDELSAEGVYRLDPVQGRLTLSSAFPGGLLELRGRRSPFALPRYQVLNPLRAWAEWAEKPEAEGGPSHPLARTGKRVPPEQRIVLGGSKSLALRLGSGEDLAVEQTLRLSLQGQIADSLFVEAQLRDDDLPFQAEGNTERLEELDKVFLRFWGRAGEARVGDFVFETKRRELSPFQRDFQGLGGRWSGGRGELSLWLARSRGLFRSEEFYGREGLQGPYELLSALRQDGAVILAGSESVFLNGRALTRGRNRDYVIDYDQGAVTFTASRPVTASDRIRVDFRYSLEAWRRAAWGAGAAGRLGGLRMDFLHFDEGDDPERPQAFVLNEENRRILEEAGDDAGLALTSGVIETPGAGHYVYVDSLSPEAPEHYEWVDSLGNYELRFRELGAGLGDYQSAGIGPNGERIFAWVGQGLGSFGLGQQLRAPESYRLESVVLEWGAGEWRARAEGALSERDANRLSGRDDGDNRGLAWRAGLEGLWRGPAGLPASLELQAESLGRRFRHPGALRGRYDYRDWSLPSRPDSLDEERLRAKLDWGESTGPGMGFAVSTLSFPGRYEGQRGSLQARAFLGSRRLDADGTLTLSEDNLLGDGRHERTTLALAAGSGWMPGLRVDGEIAARSEADSLDSYRAPEQRSSHRRLRGELRWQGRAAGGWEISGAGEQLSADEDSDRVGEIRGSLAGLGLAGGRHSFSGYFRRREGFSENEQLLGEVRSLWATVSHGWHGQGLYRIGSREQRLRETRLSFVGFGNGDTNEEGVFVGEGEGEYRRIIVPADETVRTRNLEIEGSIFHEPAREGGWTRRLASETRIALREETRGASFADLLLLRQAAFRKEGQTLFGELNLRQELRLRSPGSPWRLRYRGNWLDRLDERFTGDARRERQLTNRLRALRQGERSELILRLILEQQRRRTGESAGGSYDAGSWGLEIEGRREIWAGGRAGLRAGEHRRRDRDRSLALHTFIIEPSLSLSPFDLIRLELRWELSRSDYVEGDPAAGRPWFFDAPGWNRVLKIEGSAQAGRHLTFSALYELREEADRESRQRLRLESRAFF